MADKNMLEVRTESGIIELQGNSVLDKIELICNIGGVLLPPVALIGVGLRLFSKKYAEENMRIFADYIQKHEVTLNKLIDFTEIQVRNFSFNVQKTMENVVKERTHEKIELFAKCFSKGVSNNKVFDDGEAYEDMVYLLSSLNLNDLRVLMRMNEDTNYNDYFTDYAEYDVTLINNVYLIDSDNQNAFGFEEYDIHRMYKLVSLGLVSNKLSSEMDQIAISGSKNRIKTRNIFKLTKYFEVFKEYIT